MYRMLSDEIKWANEEASLQSNNYRAVHNV